MIRFWALGKRNFSLSNFGASVAYAPQLATKVPGADGCTEPDGNTPQALGGQALKGSWDLGTRVIIKLSPYLHLRNPN